MTKEEFEALPALTGCPGKPACDHDSLCGDHRDICRWMQRAEEKWRDMLIAAREARNRADLQIGDLKEENIGMLRRFNAECLRLETELKEKDRLINETIELIKREAGYSHWTDDVRYGLNLALKWLTEKAQTEKRNGECSCNKMIVQTDGNCPVHKRIEDPRKGCRDFAHLGASVSAQDEKGEWTLTKCSNCGQIV